MNTNVSIIIIILGYMDVWVRGIYCVVVLFKVSSFLFFLWALLSSLIFLLGKNVSSQFIILLYYWSMLLILFGNQWLKI